MKNLMLVLVLTVLFGQCTVSKNAERLSIHDIVSKELGDVDYVKIDNETKEFVLCYHRTANPLTSFGTVRYLIVNRESMQVIKRGAIRDGYIKWIGTHTLETFDTPEVLSGDEPTDNFKSIINVKVLQN
jgi:hypothetical protein